MAANAPRYIINNKIELLSFLRQNVVKKLLEEAVRQNRDKRDPLVIAVVVQYFNLGLASHGLFHNTVHQIAHSFQVTPQSFSVEHDVSDSFSCPQGVFHF